MRKGLPYLAFTRYSKGSSGFYFLSAYIYFADLSRAFNWAYIIYKRTSQRSVAFRLRGATLPLQPLLTVYKVAN